MNTHQKKKSKYLKKMNKLKMTQSLGIRILAKTAVKNPNRAINPTAIEIQTNK